MMAPWEPISRWRSIGQYASWMPADHLASSRGTESLVPADMADQVIDTHTPWEQGAGRRAAGAGDESIPGLLQRALRDPLEPDRGPDAGLYRFGGGEYNTVMKRHFDARGY